MTALRAGFRYELLMQLRKRSIWITTFALAAFTAVISIPNYGKVFDEPDARTAMVFAGQSMMVLLPVGFGCLIADRLIRDDVLGVRQVLDATPGDPGWRLAGKYLGACFAGAVPIIAVYLLVAVGYVVRGGDFAAVHWALAMSGAVVVPTLLFVGAFAMLCPLVMPAPLFRVLFVGYWFWTNQVDPVLMPTLNQTLLRPVNGYVVEVVLGATGQGPTGPVPRAHALNGLRPAADAMTTCVSIVLPLALAALALAGARALLARSSR